MIRNSAEEHEQKLKQGLGITKREFTRLDNLNNVYGFEYQIYVIFPESKIKDDIYKALSPQI